MVKHVKMAGVEPVDLAIVPDKVGMSYRRFGKRLFDLMLAVILLPLVAPVIVCLCAIIRTDGASSLFGHERVGRGGKRFKCWKIRSMVPDAKERLAEYLAANPDAAAQWEREFKLNDDPRVTQFGRFIRKTSLDELPQLWNVLRGDMSFVGPRPVVASELERYGDSCKAYFALRPGITGPWQVWGRSDVSYAERVRLDTRYAQSINIWTDVRLIVRTVGVVFAPTGK